MRDVLNRHQVRCRDEIDLPIHERQHDACPCVVLDLRHDQHAWVAVQAYIDSLRAALKLGTANDLQAALNDELQLQGVLVDPLAQLRVEDRRDE